MKKVKSFVLVLLTAVLLLSSLCACGEANLVKLDKDVATFLDSFFEAVAQEDVDKIVPYWYIPEKYADLEGIEEYLPDKYQQETNLLVSRIIRNDLGEPDKIKYTACETTPDNGAGFAIHRVEFIYEYENFELPGSVDVVTNNASGVSYIAYILVEGFYSFSVDDVLSDYLIDYDGLW